MSWGKESFSLISKDVKYCRTPVCSNETGWDRDLGPFAIVLVPRQMSPQATKYKKQGKKNNHIREQLGQIIDNKIQKDQKPNCHFLRARSKSRVLCMFPANNTTKRMGKIPEPPSGPIPEPTPTLTPYKEPACPTLGSEQARETVTCAHSLLLQQEPR